MVVQPNFYKFIGATTNVVEDSNQFKMNERVNVLM